MKRLFAVFNVTAIFCCLFLHIITIDERETTGKIDKRLIMQTKNKSNGIKESVFHLSNHIIQKMRLFSLFWSQNVLWLMIAELTDKKMHTKTAQFRNIQKCSESQIFIHWKFDYI